MTLAEGKPLARSGGAARVVVVDDDEAVLHAVSRFLKAAGADVTALSDSLEVLPLLTRSQVDAVLTDFQMPHLDGRTLLVEIKRAHPDVEVVLMTSHGTVHGAVDALQAGAFHYLTKPFEDPSEVVSLVARAVEQRRLRGREAQLERLLAAGDVEALVGKSEAMERLRRLVRTVAATPATVLLTGESGTGKERVATALHRAGERRERPLITINCAALPDALLEAELFGHAKGAFTGAATARAGLFEAADGGTLFLDEVGEMPVGLQAKLLRVLQEGEVRRLGSNDVLRVDVRLVAATNVDLEAARRAGRFREDLFYRLAVVTIQLPPLRERLDDVPDLAHHFLGRSVERIKKPIRAIGDDVLAALGRYAWPGNLRELANVIERAVVLCEGDRIERRDLPAAVAGPATRDSIPVPQGLSRMPYADARRAALAAFEESYVQQVLDEAEGNVSEAARRAGMHRANFKRILRRRDGRGADG